MKQDNDTNVDVSCGPFVGKSIAFKHTDDLPQRRTLFFKGNGSICEESPTLASNKASKTHLLDENNAERSFTGRNATIETKTFAKPYDFVKAKNTKSEDFLDVQLQDTRAAIYANDVQRTININMELESTPPFQNQSIETQENTRKIFDGTPHRSVIEFELLEREMELDSPHNQNCDDTAHFESFTKEAQGAHSKVRRQTTYENVGIELEVSGIQPIKSVCSNFESKKRSILNMTPNFSLPKKRQTLMFGNCDMDLSVDSSYQLDEKSFENINELPNSENVDTQGSDANVDQNSKNVLHKHLFTSSTHDKDMCETENMNLANDEVAVKMFNDAKGIKSLQENANVMLVPANKSTFPQDTTAGMSLFKLDESHLCETIQTARASAFHGYDSGRIMQQTFQVVKSSEEQNKPLTDMSVFEDLPITISDVSEHYLVQKTTIKTEIVADLSLNNKEITSVTVPQGVISDSTEDQTANKVAKFQKNYINLSECTILDKSDAEESEVEKIRLSLVESLLDDDDDNEDEADEQNLCVAVDDMPKYPMKKTNAMKPSANSKPVETKLTLCRKCKRCQETILNDTSSSLADSFMLPKVAKFPSASLQRLQRLRQRPTIKDVQDYWGRKLLQNVFDNSSAHGHSESLNDSVVSEDSDIAAFQKRKDELMARLRLKPNMARPHVKTEQKSFVTRLGELLRNRLPLWIFNANKEYVGILEFHHRKTPTYCINLSYKKKDKLGCCIEILSIGLQTGLAKKFWMPIDYLIDFQLELELPFDLRALCANNREESLVNMLERVDHISKDVARLSNYLWRIVCSEEASLIRNETGVYIKKIVRQVVYPENQYARVTKMEFLIQVTNMRKINFADITAPPIYLFKESIQTLPIGLDFLHVFLKNPREHLKDT